ncbi:MAG TPA: biopolymer transporter ExbD [Anaeromyxobacteraceae bacterium]|nr:biopolymer transporter ExbD [Anaeromyxobacteraceae bacterium]
MAIVTPGKRPSARFATSRILGGKMWRGRHTTNADLNVVPMVDMMTMLVIFLLQQFSATGEVLFMQKDIKLPDAQHGQQIEVAPVVAISAAQVVVSGQKVAEVSEVEKDPSQIIAPLVEKLRDEKKRWDFIHQNDQDRDKNWKGEVNVQADVRVPFRIVRRVMASAAEAGYGNVNLATVEESTMASAAAARVPR